MWSSRLPAAAPPPARARRLDAGSDTLDVLPVEQKPTVKKPARAAGQNAQIRAQPDRR
jgi:hypothetical protein